MDSYEYLTNMIDTLKKESEKGPKCTIDCSGGADTNCCKFFDLDVSYGFQDVNPMLFVVVGEVIANVLSGNLPINVANSISNIMNLVGQILETYSAQQLYQQSGPGRIYSPAYKNVANPFCNSSNTSSEQKQIIDILEKMLECIKDENSKLKDSIEGIVKKTQNIER